MTGPGSKTNDEYLPVTVDEALEVLRFGCPFKPDEKGRVLGDYDVPYFERRVLAASDIFEKALRSASAPLSETPPSGTAKVPKRMTTIEDAFPLAGEYESDARYHWRERWDAAKSYVHEVEELANKMREIWARRVHQLQPPLTDEEIAWADEYVASQSGNEESK